MNPVQARKTRKSRPHITGGGGEREKAVEKEKAPPGNFFSGPGRNIPARHVERHKEGEGEKKREKGEVVEQRDGPKLSYFGGKSGGWSPGKKGKGGVRGKKIEPTLH